jgi:hypothetical protein
MLYKPTSMECKGKKEGRINKKNDNQSEQIYTDIYNKRDGVRQRETEGDAKR